MVKKNCLLFPLIESAKQRVGKREFMVYAKEFICDVMKAVTALFHVSPDFEFDDEIPIFTLKLCSGK